MSQDGTDQYLAKIEELQQRVVEAEQLIEAIRGGEVDAFALNRNNGTEIFTLQSGDFAYRILIEHFGEGALNLTEDGLIVYSNNYFPQLFGLTYERVVGNFIFDFVHPDNLEDFNDLFEKSKEGQAKGELALYAGDISKCVYVSLTSLRPALSTIGMVITDLSEKKDHEKALQEKNEFIETLLDSSVEMIIVLDKEFRYVSLNKKAREIFQKIYEGDPIGKTILEVNPDSMQTLAFEDLLQAFDGKEIHSQEYKSEKSDRYFDINYIPIRRDREVSNVMVMIREVTDAVKAREDVIRANKQLQERNIFIETIIESSNELIVVYDPQLHLMSLNKAAESFMNRKKEDVIGKTLYELYPEAKGSKGEQDLIRALSGEYVQNAPYLSTLTGRYVQNYLTPLFDTDGHVNAALAIAHDVTDIKKTEEDLIRSQHHFSMLFSVSPVALSLSQVENGKMLEVNDAWEKMFHLPRAQVIGKTAEELNLINPEDRQRYLNTIMEAGGHATGLELKFNSPGKAPVYAYLSVEKIELDGIPCLIKAYFDVSERRKAEEAIRSANKQLEEKNAELAQSNTELASFSYIASHDLQEPLRKIQTFSNRILDKSDHELSALTTDYFQRIISASHRMQNLITALLNYSRMNTSEMDFAKLDLDQAVIEVKSNLAELFEENNAKIISDPLPVMEVIPLQFNQLLTNIFTNAIKYRRPEADPVITITAELMTESQKLPFPMTAPAYYKIAFRDNGIGFDPRYAEKIFELFQRLHGKQEYEGTGIGLAICKKIIQNHKGFIKAEGFPGEGALFTIYLPTKPTPHV